MACWSSRSAALGSMPSSSTSNLRVAAYNANASDWRPERYRASIRCAQRRSRSGCWAVSVSSSATSAAWRPSSRSASIRSLERLQAQLLQAGDLAGGEGVEGEVGQRRTPPQGQGLAENVPGTLESTLRVGAPSLLEESLEDAQVNLRRIDSQHIPVVACDDRIAGRPGGTGERLAQPRHVDLHRLGRPRRRLVTPQLVHQPVARDDLARVQDQHGEHRALLMRPQGNRLPLVPDLQITEDPEFHLPPPL